MVSLQNHIRLSRIHTWIERTEHLANLLTLVQGFNIRSFLALGHGILKLWTEIKGADNVTWNWNSFRLSQATKWLFNQCCEARWKQICEFEAEDRVFTVYDVNGVHFVVNHDNDLSWVERQEDLETIKEDVRQHAEETLGNLLLAVAGEEDKVVMTSCDEVPVFPSEEAERIWTRLEKFLKEGIHRAVVLDGPPGTGKTTIAWYLATKARELLGPKSRVLRIQVGDFQQLKISALEELMTFLRVNILVIDDFDQVQERSFLHFLEACHRKMDLVLVTSNNLNSMGSAIRRPKRLDEVFTIHHLGVSFTEEYLESIWDRIPNTARPEVLKWPIVYLEELKDRARVVEDLTPEIKDLQTRWEGSKGTESTTGKIPGPSSDEGPEESVSYARGKRRRRV